MPDKIPEAILESVAVDNVKSVAGGAAFYANLAMANAVSHQGRMNVVAEAAVGTVVKNLTELDAQQAASVNKTLTGNDLAAQIAQLIAAVAGGEQASKTAGNTPPVTP